MWGQVEVWNHKGTQEIYGGDIIFIIVMMMTVSQMYTYVKAYQLKYVQLIVMSVILNKAFKNRH